jgi:transposase
MNKPLTDDERVAILADWRASGLTGAVYARERGINLHTLRMWTRKLRTRLNDALVSAAPPDCPAAPSFVEYVLPTVAPESAAAPFIEVTLAGAMVRVPQGADADTLTSVFAALRGNA